jgi:hypothetical protein
MHGPSIYLGKQRGDIVVKQRDTDLLTLALEQEELSEGEREAFGDMAAQLTKGSRALSDQQRGWVEGVLTKLDICLPPELLVSSGKVKAVAATKPEALPAVLKKLPLDPPHRATRNWRDV